MKTVPDTSPTPFHSPGVSNEGWLYVHGQATVGDLTGGGRVIVGNGTNTARDGLC